MRFSLRSLFVAVTIAAVFCGIISGVSLWFRDFYFVQLRRVNSVLAEFPEIDRVWLSTNNDIELEVEQVYFTIVGEPKVTYGIVGIDGASKSEIRKRLANALRKKQLIPLPNYVTEHHR